MPRRPRPGRRAGVRGTVKETPRAGSGAWIALLPPNLSQGRRSALPDRYTTKTAARKALNEAIVDIERGQNVARSGRTGGMGVRKIDQVIKEYITTRTNDPLAPLASKTVNGYLALYKNQINHPRANMGLVDVRKLTTPAVGDWLRDLKRGGTTNSQADHARRLLSSALSWEVMNGRLNQNPCAALRMHTSKASRLMNQRPDTVFLPTWSEMSDLICFTKREEDAVLITLLAWTGLRWSEAVALNTDAVWTDKPRLSISRVLARSNGTWVVEAPKGGLALTVPLPTPLWKRLKKLKTLRLSQPALPLPAGRLLFRPEIIRPKSTGIHIIDNSVFRKNVWEPAREACGLDGNPSLPELDARRNPIKIKDLRAFAASVFTDAGANIAEAAALLRHSDQRTTQIHYNRAQLEKENDPARMAIRADQSLTTSERIEKLWLAWEIAFPDAVKKCGIPTHRANNRANRRNGLRSV
jgi:integrase